MSQVQNILKKWGTRPALAEAVGLSQPMVQSWWHTKSIPAWHIPTLAKAAALRGWDDVTEATIAAACKADYDAKKREAA